MPLNSARLVALLLLASANPLSAQDAAPPEAGIIRLEPKTMEGVDRGKAVVVKGRVGTEPQRFMLDGIGYMNPVAVVVRPVARGDRVDLAVSKYAWNQPLRQGHTEGDMLRFQFRTEGEFQLSVSAPEPDTDYRLLVWVGDETQPDFAPVVVKASEYEEKGGGSLVLWVIAGALVLVVLLLAVIVLRRKPS